MPGAALNEFKTNLTFAPPARVFLYTIFKVIDLLT
jgi:hypothetical protein